VFSRRLGRSLGVDLVPFKVCTYDCIYCQLGRTTSTTIERRQYIPVDDVLEEVKTALTAAPLPDTITLAGSGEPTLNDHTGDLIRGLKRLTRIPVAVLTNGSLLWMDHVREELREADIVLPSLDAGDETLFRLINRPHGDIGFERVIGGLVEFTARFTGSVWLEIFLLAGVTAIASEVEKISTLARRVRPARIQLNTVARPPAESFALPVGVQQLVKFSRSFTPHGEVIPEIRFVEGQHATGRPDEELLALLSRRPCTLEDVAGGLGIHVGEAAKQLAVLTRKGRVRQVHLSAKCFYTVAVSGRTGSGVKGINRVL
jgi:wyosine [tRNA(Phe)-imidazoG37] synthetase (radical SAM superfamily)